MMRRAAWWMVVLASMPLQCAIAQQADDENPLQLLLAARYDTLDALLQGKQVAYKRGELGDDELLAAFRPFYDVDNPAYLQHLEAWVSAKPGSYVARLSLGIHHKYRGIRARGDGPANLVPESHMRDYVDEFADARDALSASLDLDDMPLLSYHHLMDPSGSLTWFDSNRRLLDKAIAVDPGNLIVRRKYLLTLRERWGGSLRKMNEFVDECRGAGLTESRLAKLERELEAERAFQSYRNGNYARAERIYSDLVASDPEDVGSRVFLLTTLVKLRKCEQAVSVADQVLRARPQHGIALANRGFCHVHEGRFQEGVADYHAAASVGEVWSLKELARLYWHGKHVEKDRNKANELMRRAALSGDPDAQRELERVTGERIVTRASLRDALPVLLGIALPLAVIGLLATIARRRGAPQRLARSLDIPLSQFWVAATALIVLTCVLYMAAHEPSRAWWNPLVLASLAVILLNAAWRAVAVILERRELLVDGIAYSRIWGARGELAWNAIARVEYSAPRSSFRLTGHDGRTIRVQDGVRNITLFAQQVLAHVPRSAMDENTWCLLDEFAHPERDDPAAGDAES